MSKKNKIPDIINNVRLCDSCKNCTVLNSDEIKVKTKHFSPEEYEWDAFAGQICKLLAVQLNNVSDCNKYEKKAIIEKLN